MWRFAARFQKLQEIICGDFAAFSGVYSFKMTATIFSISVARQLLDEVIAVDNGAIRCESFAITNSLGGLRCSHRGDIVSMHRSRCWRFASQRSERLLKL
jgi:hypothetical protein